MKRPFSRLASLVVTTVMAIAPAAVAADRHHNSGHADGHSEHHGAPFHHPRSSFGLFFGAPAPPVYYTPAYPYYPPYPYAPVPVSGFYWTAYGYCRDFQTAIGVETACQQPDGIWRFIN